MVDRFGEWDYCLPTFGVPNADAAPLVYPSPSPLALFPVLANTQ